VKQAEWRAWKDSSGQEGDYFMKKWRALKAMTGLATASILIAGCGSTPASNSASNGTSGSSTVDTNGTVNMATVADPNFNPWSPTGYLESDPITEIIFDGLTKWGINQQPVPDLATDWSVSKDGLTWTFNLRRDVKWQDGQPFTSSDVVYTFENIVLNTKVGANGSSRYADVTQVKANGPYQVQFILKKPWSSLPTILAYYTKILPEHIFKGKDPWKLTSFNKEHPIGTGPFEVTNYVPGQYIELQRNDNYFGGKPKIKKVIFHIIPDTNTQIAQVLSGSLSLVQVPDPTLVSKLQSDPNVELNMTMDNTWYWIALDLRQQRFQDVRVRQALEYAIDRNAIIKGVLKGYGQVATGPIAPVLSKWYDGNVQQYRYDPEKAKALLKEAGYTPGPDGILQKDGVPFVINMPTAQYGVLTPASELVQQYWKAIGVKVNLNVMDWNTYIQKTTVNAQFDATLCWWHTPADPDQYAYFASEAAGKGWNIPQYRNPELDQLFLKARAAATDSERKDALDKAQFLMAKELPYLFLWYPQIIVAYQKNLHIPNAPLIPAEDNIVDWEITN
jgi:peptide/nickel transport system substrate-binding protein